jgi:hypothetical protein
MMTISLAQIAEPGLDPGLDHGRRSPFIPGDAITLVGTTSARWYADLMRAHRNAGGPA